MVKRYLYGLRLTTQKIDGLVDYARLKAIVQRLNMFARKIQVFMTSLTAN